MQLLETLNSFREEWIAIHPVRCLNPRHRQSFCDVCVKTCPQQAIRADVEDVEIDPDLCNNCGLCVTDCPTGVFAHDYFNGMKLIQWAKGRSTFELLCPKSGYPEPGSGQAAIPCHGMLDTALLAGLKSIGVEKIHLKGVSRCDECPTRLGRERVTQLNQEGKTDAFPELIMTDADHAAADETVPASVEAEQGLRAEPETSRRGFFRQMVRKGAEGVVSTSFVHLLEPREEQVSSELIGVDEAALNTKYVPVHHRATLTALVAGNVNGVNDRLHRITASDACDGCQVCAIRCPTGALRWQDNGDSVQLTYRTAACIGCGLCVSICPYDALTLSRQENQDAVLQDQTEELFVSKQLSCEQCGDKFLPHDGDNRYCWICKNEMEMDNQWMSFLKHPQNG